MRGSRSTAAVEQRVDQAAQGGDVAPPAWARRSAAPALRSRATTAAPAWSGVIRFIRKSGAISSSTLGAGPGEGVLDHLACRPSRSRRRWRWRPTASARSAGRGPSLDPGLGGRVGAVRACRWRRRDRGDDDEWPLRSTICGSAARTVRQTPSRSTSKTRSHSSVRDAPASSPSAAGRCRRWRSRRRARRSARPSPRPRPRIAPWSVTSAAIPIARSPIRSAASRASPASRSTTATEAPRMCIWRAVSKPIPRAAPVTSATFPFRS